MSFPMFEANETDMSGTRIYGAVIGIVTNSKDPEGLGRVKLKYPWLSDQNESNWARVATPMAGNQRGFFFIPEVDDEVLVVFEQGDMNFPYVIGALWNGKDKPPVKNDDGKNNVRLIKSRSGHCIRLTDEDGKEKIEIEDKSGKNKIVVDTASKTISIITDKDLKLTADNGEIILSANTIVLDAKSSLEVKSAGSAKLEAKATLDVKGQLVNIN
ncbi:phage baseplate assembly protein V [Nitrosomonas sp. PY1]|uniref:phage baseplate assembly protein V n=1 Tax=Nitrosomonas sp. PY1 TaxID=1803906 RepID=UPI001FC8C99E|nr:phage baseplate assembly protein V [Nitrosomonas sp. PY1]